MAAVAEVKVIIVVVVVVMFLIPWRRNIVGRGLPCVLVLQSLKVDEVDIPATRKGTATWMISYRTITPVQRATRLPVFQAS